MKSGDESDYLTILGGGPAGLGTAYYAHRAGIPFRLYEQASRLGGLCQTFRCGRHAYDCGAHRFHDRIPEITADVRALLGSELVPVTSPSKIYDAGRFINFPPTPLNLIRNADLGELWGICAELVRGRRRRSADRSFEDFAFRNFGETLACRYLLNYSEKVWGLPAEQLSPDVATRRLAGMSLATLLREFVMSRELASHIDGTFLYPRGGYGRIAEAIADALPAECITTGDGVARLICDGTRISEVVLASGESVKPRGQVVSTLPLTVVVGLLGAAVTDEVRDAARGLRFRSIRLLFLRLARPSVSENATIYLPQQEFCFTRIHEPRNRSEQLAPPGETGIVVEVPCFTDDPLFSQPAERLVQRVVSELSQTGLIGESDLLEWQHRVLATAYPVYGLGYADKVASVAKGLARITNLTALGRNAEFAYGHLHDQLHRARQYVASSAWRSISG